MSSKDVWRWLLPKFSNEVLVQIYIEKEITFKSVRTNKIKSIINKTNRNMLISNLLDTKNYPKLMSWSKGIESNLLEGLSLVDKEVNELVNIAEHSNAATVFAKLFSEDQEKKAVQLYALLKDEQSELLNVPNESITLKSENTKSDDKKTMTKQKPISNEKLKEETTTSKKDQKKIQQLEQKVDNLTKELRKRDENHKKKIDEMKESNKKTTEKLNEKNRLYSELLKENEVVTNEYKGEQEKWNKEKSEYEETIKNLQGQLNHLHAKQINEKQLQELSREDSDNKTTTEMKVTLNQTNKTRILVIGKPLFTQPFQDERIEFNFVESDDVHKYPFTRDYEDYWILSYELNHQNQMLLNTNDSYLQLDKKKIKICKDFSEVRELLSQYNGRRERVM
ncbi:MULTISPECIES: hypothetical protein [Bacillus]|uniref:Uncharacterized protein n=1 Tax=Bacillus cereus TaxID=1396 RepID=A0A9X7B7K0_BACCE|nr:MULTISPECIES: hypothetical protein [Bacillus cereus group]EKS7875395.1 hypothetical protein [Bacillus cereus]MDF9473444.1 hypothetical protein [Bacillus cereus]PED43251.1 hypothetical protein CON26_15300 [Bacillus cereus]PFV02768.1 hypothetical protein COK98_26135 [Bacillus cereus]HDR7725263.1 hypothetical protein [Bacillus cereus]